MEDDDIDDLLSEVESKFCSSHKRNVGQQVKKHTGSATGTVTSGSGSHVTKPRGAKTDAELTAMIDDIFDDPHDLDTIPHSKSKTSSNSSSRVGRHPTSNGSAPVISSGTKKCFPLHIAGSAYEQGLSTAVNQRGCDRMRCTDCDFLVSAFDNYQWHSSTDYLFLRNNMPDLDRLRPKLVGKKGYRAYACQCKSRSTKDMLAVDKDLKWVCGKH